MLIKVIKEIVFRRGGGAHASGDEEYGFRYSRRGIIVAFIPPSQGDALKEHTIEIFSPLVAHGGGIKLIDMSKSTWGEDLSALSGEDVWFATGAFGAGEWIRKSNGEFFSPWSKCNIPFLRLYGDCPAYFPMRHEQHLNTSINIYGHREHYRQFVRYFDKKSISANLPLFPFDENPLAKVDLSKKVSGAVLFPKNGNDPEGLRSYWRKALPQHVSNILFAGSEVIGQNIDEAHDFFELINKLFFDLEIDLSGNRDLMFFLVAQLDDYARRVKSDLLARVAMHYPVIIRGINWDHLDFSKGKAIRDYASDYESTRPLLDSSLAVLDMSPNTSFGAHDRVLRAAGRYTTFLTNSQSFYKENFDNHNKFTYFFNENSISQLLDSVFSSPKSYVDLGVEQGKRMREVLSKERFFEQMLTLLSAFELAAGDRPPGTQNFVDFANKN